MTPLIAKRGRAGRTGRTRGSAMVAKAGPVGLSAAAGRLASALRPRARPRSRRSQRAAPRDLARGRPRAGSRAPVPVPLGRARVVRVLRRPLERVAEGLLDARCPRGRAPRAACGSPRRRPPSPPARRPTSTYGPDRDDVGGEVLVDALVEALVAAAEQGQRPARRQARWRARRRTAGRPAASAITRRARRLDRVAAVAAPRAQPRPRRRGSPCPRRRRRACRPPGRPAAESSRGCRRGRAPARRARALRTWRCSGNHSNQPGNRVKTSIFTAPAASSTSRKPGRPRCAAHRCRRARPRRR